ncbi:MAG: serine/threonine-protein kinase, partial [Woeseia sp.]
AHQNGILHRDVKPMNILFTAEGVPKITDFGNAKLTESVVHTREGEMIGSPSFMSPEQITGKQIDQRTDIYSLGVTLYQMLTGKVPFEGEMSSILAQHVTKTPQAPGWLNENIPKALDSVLLTMLGKAPEDRYQDMDAVISALQAVELKSPEMAVEV